MSAVAWLLVAGGLTLLGSAGRSRGARAATGRMADGPRETNRHRPRRAEAGHPARLIAVTVAGAAVIAVALLGPAHGLVLALPLGAILTAGGPRLISAGRTRPVDRSLPLTLDLAAAALRGGQPVATALRLAAPAAAHPGTADALLRVAGLLRLGTDPVAAWSELVSDPLLAPVALASRRSAASGTRLAAAWEQLADDLRAGAEAAARARAERGAVWALLPLAGCFLPAFVCIGIVPDLIGIAHDVLPPAR